MKNVNKNLLKLSLIVFFSLFSYVHAVEFRGAAVESYKGASSKKKINETVKVIENFKNTSLLNIRLHTGRFHQIRAQLSFIGYPIVGDKKYGASSVLPEGRIALHAQSIVFNHPTRKKEIIINCPLPEDWPSI